MNVSAHFRNFKRKPFTIFTPLIVCFVVVFFFSNHEIDMTNTHFNPVKVKLVPKARQPGLAYKNYQMTKESDRDFLQQKNLDLKRQTGIEFQGQKRYELPSVTEQEERGQIQQNGMTNILFKEEKASNRVFKISSVQQQSKELAKKIPIPFQSNVLTDDACRQRLPQDLKLSDHDLPLTALASPWRSGNTWVRHLLQQATGIGTSSIYCDGELRANGFPYECHLEKHRALVVKTHQPHHDPRHESPPEKAAVKLQFDQAILIIRDPYEFIVGNIHSTHLGTVPEDAYFKHTEWRNSHPYLLKWWNDYNGFWLFHFKGRVLPVLYSKLQDDLDQELKRMLDFLDWTYSDTDINCALKFREGNFHRKSTRWTKIKSIVELFDTNMQKSINQSKAEISKILKTNYNVVWE